MKVVLDTNVFISGIFWSGHPFEILDAWRNGKFELVVSRATLAELERVLAKFEMSKENITKTACLVHPSLK